MTNLQLKVSASLKQALDKLKLSSENEEKKGKGIGGLSRYMMLIVTQINEILLFLKWLFHVIMFLLLIIWEIPSSVGNDNQNLNDVESWVLRAILLPLKSWTACFVRFPG